MAALVLAAMVGTWGASNAEATSYRFWSYWVGSDSGWTFSSQGASRRPANGTVDGWRFAVSEASSSTTPPRHTASFARICGATPPQEGKKRVGLVVDFGTTADAPDGETPPALVTTCVVAPEDANGYTVLASAVQLRTDAGLICGMNGYPETECGVAVADPTASPSTAPPKNGGGSGGAPGGGDDGSSGSTTSSTPNKQPDAATSQDEGGDSGQKKSGQNKKKASKDTSATTAADPPAASGVVDVSPAAAMSPPSSANGSPLGLLAGGVVVAVLLGTAVVVRRRRT